MNLLTPFLVNIIHAKRGIPNFHVDRAMIDVSYERAKDNAATLYGGTDFSEDDAIELIAASILMSDMEEIHMAVTLATVMVKHFGKTPPDNPATSKIASRVTKFYQQRMQELQASGEKDE